MTGFRRLTAFNGSHALEALSRYHVDVVLLDVNLQEPSGIELLRQIRASRDDVEVISMMPHAGMSTAVGSHLRAGAFDVLAKSYENYQQIGDYVGRAIEHRRRRHAAILGLTDENLRAALALLEQTQSSEMAEVNRVLGLVAAKSCSLLLEGEAGVGKGLLARKVHLQSERAASPFVPVNVLAMPARHVESTLFGHEDRALPGTDRERLGRCELADGGTLFLDEVAALGPGVQARLLRALQEQQIERIGAPEPAPIDVRFIAATGKDLEAEVRAGRFREDLWHLLKVNRVAVPPLRRRRADIPRLMAFLAERNALAMGRTPPRFSDEAVQALSEHDWPGNVRELEQLVIRLITRNSRGSIGRADIPVEFCAEHLSQMAPRTDGLHEMALRHFERFFVRLVVDRCGGNEAEAARHLGLTCETVGPIVDSAEAAPPCRRSLVK